MTRLSIQVPDELKGMLEARAAESGHPSVEAYVEALVREDARMIHYGAPAHLRVGSREQLEALVLEGLESPARAMSSGDWERMRQSLIEQNRRAKAG